MSNIQPGYYRHYKGNIYRVFGTAFHTEEAICFVIYGKDGIEWARPYRDFISSIVFFE